MPQFDPTYFYSQIFWLFVSFVFLYLLMVHFILPRVSSILDERAMTIERDIEQARKIRNEAEYILEKYNNDIAEAKQSSQRIMQQSYEKSILKAENKKKDINVELETIVAQAEADMLKLKERIIKDIEKSETELVQNIISDVPGLSVSSKKIDEALAKARANALH